MKETSMMGGSQCEALEDLGRRIARLREAKDWTRAELAQRVGVPRERLGAWERGENTPPLEIVTALGRELGVSLDELVTGSLADGFGRGKKDKAISHLAAVIKLLR